MNIKMLNDKIKESGIKKCAITDHLGCTYQTLSRKLDGSVFITTEEATKLSNILKLSNKEKIDIFFGE